MMPRTTTTTSDTSAQDPPPSKARRTSAVSAAVPSLRRRLASPMTTDRHSCLAAPYSPTDPRTARFFDIAISKASAPVTCASAGKLKGKAIYADRDLPKNTQLWTESPYVAMQHEHNKREIPCCQYCFVPLLADYKAQWTRMAAQWNDAHLSTNNSIDMATPQDLDAVLAALQLHRRQCGLAHAAATCVCGDQYCSKLCQMRAFHEFHAILCPRKDPFSAMSVLLRHARETNDIFLLVARVIARVLSRFLVMQDLVKAREPMDMFHKKPWWEVVMVEKHVQRRSTQAGGNSSTEEGSGSSGGEEDALLPSSSSSSSSSPTTKINDEDDDDMTDGSSLSPPPPPPLTDASSQFLKDLLVSTHQLVVDALESNLVHLEREDQLHGHRVNDLWTSCASVLSFEFFAAQLGLFEMNNIRVEIDHPFVALAEMLDDNDDQENDDDNRDQLFARVRSVLAFATANGTANGTTATLPSVDGTALFSIICTMNHSCDPNCTVLYTKNGDAHVVAVRDIAKGDELCICYIDVDQDVLARDALLQDYQFRCICPRCIFERRQLKEQAALATTQDPK